MRCHLKKHFKYILKNLASENNVNNDDDYENNNYEDYICPIYSKSGSDYLVTGITV